MSEQVTLQKLYDLMVHMNEKMDGVRNELKSDMISLREELKQDMSNLRTELKQDMTNLRAELKEDMLNLRTEQKQDMLNLSTEQKQDMLILTTKLDGFQKDVSTQFVLLVNDRLDLIERRQDFSSVRLDRVEAKVSQLAEKQ